MSWHAPSFSLLSIFSGPPALIGSYFSSMAAPRGLNQMGSGVFCSPEALELALLASHSPHLLLVILCERNLQDPKVTDEWLLAPRSPRHAQLNAFLVGKAL